MKKIISLLTACSLMGNIGNVISCGTNNDSNNYFYLDFIDWAPKNFDNPSDFMMKITLADIATKEYDFSTDIRGEGADSDIIYYENLNIKLNNTNDTLLKSDGKMSYYLSEITLSSSKSFTPLYEYETANLVNVYDFIDTIFSYNDGYHPNMEMTFDSAQTGVSIDDIS